MKWYWWYLSGLLTIPAAVVGYYTCLLTGEIVSEIFTRYRRNREIVGDRSRWLPEARVVYAESDMGRLYCLKRAIYSTFGINSKD